MPWICADCGAEHQKNNPPCRKCASERFARLDASQCIQRIQASNDVVWACKECGKIHRGNSPPCNSCGGMMFESVEGLSFQDSIHDVSDAGNTESRTITGWIVAQYMIGVPLLILGILYTFGTVLGGMSWVIASAVTMPHSRRVFEDRLNAKMSSVAVTMLVFALFIVGYFFIAQWNAIN